MQANYFFIDGSALTAQIRQLQRAREQFRGKLLCPRTFLKILMLQLRELHDGSYKRAIFFFPTGDEANVAEFVELPQHGQPGFVRDLSFKYCGTKLKKSAEFDRFVEESVPDKFQSRFSKSEKGIDIEICCDALKLATRAHVERIFLLSNDGDFIPLCRTLKEFGFNVSVVHLSSETQANGELLKEADSYDVIKDSDLEKIFVDKPGEKEDGLAVEAITAENAIADELRSASEKPETVPSDLKLVEGDVDAGGDENG